MTSSSIENCQPVYCITGVCGFIGRSVARNLLKNGLTVIGIDSCEVLPADLEEYVQYGRMFFLPQDFFKARTDIKHILNNRHDCQKVMIHLAGIADAGICSKNPERAYAANVHLTWEIACFCADAGIGRCLFASTGYVYGTSTRMRLFKETDTVKADSVYAATKIASEHLLSVQSHQNDFQAVIMRFSNVYGKDSNSKTVLGKIIDQAKKNLPVTVRDASPVRDFIHIDDVAEAVMRLSKVSIDQQAIIVNVSTGRGIRIAEAAAIAAQACGKVYDGVTQQDSVGNMLVLDTSFLECLVGWVPEITISQGLQQIITSKER